MNQVNQNGDNKDKSSFSYAFKQQVMKAWQPVPTINSTIILFVLLTIFFVVFGIILLTFSLDVKEYSYRYDDTCQQQNKQPCEITFTIDNDMDSPVFVYYELENYYQNHRAYVKSRSVDQLLGSTISSTDADTNCKPIVYNRDVAVGLKSFDGKVTLNPDDVANPCGLIAKSIFNDTFEIKNLNNVTQYQIIDTGIAWPSDKKNKYKRNADTSKQWLDVENERFMVWMRTSALPYFRKLWGKIETKVVKGTYILSIKNQYDVSKFDGKKFFVLSTANAFGGKNQFLAIAYLVVGGLCFIITVAFFIKKLMSGKKNDQKSN